MVVLAVVVLMTVTVTTEIMMIIMTMMVMVTMATTTTTARSRSAAAGAAAAAGVATMGPDRCTVFCLDRKKVVRKIPTDDFNVWRCPIQKADWGGSQEPLLS
jgi:hypothetical protein